MTLFEQALRQRNLIRNAEAIVLIIIIGLLMYSLGWSLGLALGLLAWYFKGE